MSTCSCFFSIYSMKYLKLSAAVLSHFFCGRGNAEFSCVVNPDQPTGSRLSQHIGNLFFHNVLHTLNWSIIAQKQPFNPVGNFCMLCNVEKVLILYHPELSTLNIRNELYGWCPHKEKFLLLNT